MSFALQHLVVGHHRILSAHDLCQSSATKFKCRGISHEIQQFRRSIITYAVDAKQTQRTASQRISFNASKIRLSKTLRDLSIFQSSQQSELDALIASGDGVEKKLGEVILQENLPVDGLYVLLEGSSTSGSGPRLLGVEDLLFGRKATVTEFATTDVKLWRVDQLSFDSLVQEHPDIGLTLFKAISPTLATAIKGENSKRQNVQPFLVPAPKLGVIGKSKYASRLRKSIIKAARNRQQNLMFFGEPGTEKLNCAALVHFGSEARKKPLVLFDCARLDRHASALFGKGEKHGLLEDVDGGSIVLTNVHRAPKEMLPQLAHMLETGRYSRLGNSESEHELSARVMMTAEKQIPSLAKYLEVIKVAPLRLRPNDIKEYQAYFAKSISKRTGQPIMLTPEAVKHVQSYSFPGNVQELEAMMERAAVQQTVSDKEVPEDIFWFATQGKDRFRFNLLARFPLLKKVLRSWVWPKEINFRFTAYVYPVLVALLLFGPQDRSHNFVLNFFWAYWWPGIFLIYPFLGRIWCAVCPFMIYGELVQKWRVANGAVLKKWPHASVERYGGWFMLALFAGILVWEEVWDLPNSAALSGWLLILITVGAMVCSAIFERRLWCRHLCPIGAMNGLFAKTAMTEVRAAQGVCAGNCNTYHCYKGGPEEPPEGLETNGCPLASHPAQLVDNANCVLCMDCLKACPHGSVQVRLRPPLADIFGQHKPSAEELSLLLMLLGAVYLHNLPHLLSQLQLSNDTVSSKSAHIIASALVLSLPGLAIWAIESASSWWESQNQSQPHVRHSFLKQGYAYVPLVWGATLSFYLHPLLMEGGRILQVTAATAHLDFLEERLPAFVMDSSVVAFLQGTTLITGFVASLVLLRTLQARPWGQIIPQLSIMTLLFGELCYLNLSP